MKRYALAFAALIALGAGEIATAQAQQFEVGPGGVYVGRDRYDGYRERRSYDGYESAVPTTDMKAAIVVACGVSNARKIGVEAKCLMSACNGAQQSWLAGATSAGQGIVVWPASVGTKKAAAG